MSPDEINILGWYVGACEASMEQCDLGITYILDYNESCFWFH